MEDCRVGLKSSSQWRWCACFWCGRLPRRTKVLLAMTMMCLFLGGRLPRRTKVLLAMTMPCLFLGGRLPRRTFVLLAMTMKKDAQWRWWGFATTITRRCLSISSHAGCNRWYFRQKTNCRWLPRPRRFWLGRAIIVPPFQLGFYQHQTLNLPIL